jgi:RNA polymerase sigma factor (sigma-70 family)
MKELRLVAKIRNNRLMELREAKGLSARDLADAIGIRYEMYLGLEGLRYKPWGKRGKFGKPGWLKPARAVADFFGYPPDYLFPDCVRDIVKARTERRLNAEEVYALGNQGVGLLDAGARYDAAEFAVLLESALQTLSPRERKVIELRFGFVDSAMTLADVSDQIERVTDGHIGVTRDRVRQIEQKALRKIREQLKGMTPP